MSNIAEGIAGFILFGLSVTFVASSMADYSENQDTEILTKNAFSVNESFSKWIKDNPEASLEIKKTALTDIAQPFLSDGTVGIALDAKENTVCLWDTDTKKNTNANAVSFSSKEKGTDCTQLETVFAPDGSTVAMSENPIAEPVKVAEPAPDFPWSMMLGILASTGVALGGGSGVIFGVKKYRRNRSIAADTKSKWAALIQRHDVVRKAWAEYELDPIKMLDYPVLSDMRETVTVNLHLALRKANELKPSNANLMSTQDPNGSPYQEAVISAEHAFNVALREAKRIQWSKFSADEQKRLTTAKTLLSLVLDGGASEFERQAAYKRLNKEITGLISLPDASLIALESSIKVMIEA